MGVRAPDVLARRYVAWLRRRSGLVFGIAALLLAGSVYLIAFHLPLRADFSYLLPQDVPAVRDLRRLEARVKSSETVLVLVKSETPASTAAAAEQMRSGLVALRSPLIERVTGDEAETRAFLYAHRHLFVPLEDLERARAALKNRIDGAKLAANPLYIELGDANDQLVELREKRKEAEAKLSRPTNLSPDGAVGKLEVATSFRATDATRGAQLLEAMAAVRARVLADHPDVKIGFTGSVVTALAEHRAITRGIALSSVFTAALVALLLALYFRSAMLLTLLVGTIGAATGIAFGAAAITVGHLNAATAFLGAIIAGNGINYGILLIARYLEERRRHDIDESLALAIVGTVRPTVVASLGASIAYGSLAVTSFKGFADFAVIGAVGMLLCWIASYSILPALMLRFGRSTNVFHGDPFVGGTLARLFGFRRSTAVVLAAVVVLSCALVLVTRYVASAPFEYNIKNLRSEGSDAIESRTWMKISDASFGRGISGRTYIAADRAAQVPLIVDALHAIDVGKRPDQRTIGTVESILTFVPSDQDKRLAILEEIRSMLDEAADELSPEDRAEIIDLRPPDGLATFTSADLPASLRDRFSEKDGRIGLLISIRPALQLDEWNGKDLIRFATAVRTLHLRDNETVTTSGSSVIFADIVAAIEHDGVRVTLVALVGLVVMVLLLVGYNRRAVAVMCGTAGGALLMIAVCALVGIKISFLDFVALPITLGLGIDYAINVAHRHESEAIPDPVTTLRTSGSAVLVCSLTTMIGYGSLLVSDNLAIRGFGTASLIGEVTTVLTALVLVPALLAVWSRRRLTGEPT